MQVRRAMLHHEGLYKCNSMHSNHFKLRVRNKRVSSVSSKKSKTVLFPSTIIDIGNRDDRNDVDDVVETDVVEMVINGKETEVPHLTYRLTPESETVPVTDVPVEHHQHHHNHNHNGHRSKPSVSHNGQQSNQSDNRRHGWDAPADYDRKLDNLFDEDGNGRPHERVHTSNEATSNVSDVALEPVINYEDSYERPAHNEEKRRPHSHEKTHLNKVDKALAYDTNEGATNHFANDDVGVLLMNSNGLLSRGANDENGKNTRLLINDKKQLTDHNLKASRDDKLLVANGNSDVERVNSEPIHSNQTERPSIAKNVIRKCTKCLEYSDENGKIVVLEDVIGETMVLPTPPLTLQANDIRPRNQTASQTAAATNTINTAAAVPAAGSAKSTNTNDSEIPSNLTNLGGSEHLAHTTNTTNAKLRKGEPIACFFFPQIFLFVTRFSLKNGKRTF